MGDGPVLLYDGTCGLCAGVVRFVLRHERRPGTLRFAPRAGAFGRAVRARHPVLDAVDSVVWIEAAARGTPERIFMRSAAALKVADHLGGAWRLANVLRLVPAPLRDVVYDLAARHRHRLARPGAGAAASACAVPPPEAADRFIMDP